MVGNKIDGADEITGVDAREKKDVSVAVPHLFLL
jgi:hypothetical protein